MVVFITILTFFTYFRLVIRIRKVGSWFVKSILVRFSLTDLAEIAQMNYIWSILTVCNQILNFWKILIFDHFSSFRYDKKNFFQIFLKNWQRIARIDAWTIKCAMWMFKFRFSVNLLYFKTTSRIRSWLWTVP